MYRVFIICLCVVSKFGFLCIGRGRGDFHRSTSYPEDSSANYYSNRASGEWSESRGSGRGGMSRASRDGNWRTSAAAGEEEGWNNHWHPPPSPGQTRISCIFLVILK